MFRSSAAFWFAKKYPSVAKGLLRFCCEGILPFFPNAKPEEHWVLRPIANDLGYRIPGKGVLANGMKIRIPRNDGVGRIILSGRYHETETVGILKRLLRPRSVFIDAGAHVGQFTLLASQLVGDSGTVHSFEPDPETFRWLSHNVAQNRLTNVHLNQLALSSKTERKTFFPGTPEGMASSSLANHAEFTGRSFQVSCTTVDDYVKDKHVGTVDVIKMDVEGAELDMLHGARCLLSMEEKPFLIVEFEEGLQKTFGSSCAKLAEFLRQNSYFLFRVGNPPLEQYAPRSNDPYWFNVLAIPDKRLTSVSDLLE